jgi:flagellar hook-basal body complex protein FliE
MVIKGAEQVVAALKSSFAAEGAKESPEGAFADRLSAALQSTNDYQMEANTASEALATGAPVSLHDAMISVEKADISMRLFVSVTRKALEAYQEIMRMQI